MLPACRTLVSCAECAVRDGNILILLFFVLLVHICASGRLHVLQDKCLPLFPLHRLWCVRLPHSAPPQTVPRVHASHHESFNKFNSIAMRIFAHLHVHCRDTPQRNCSGCCALGELRHNGTTTTRAHNRVLRGATRMLLRIGHNHHVNS